MSGGQCSPRLFIVLSLSWSLSFYYSVSLACALSLSLFLVKCQVLPCKCVHSSAHVTTGGCLAALPSFCMHASMMQHPTMLRLSFYIPWCYICGTTPMMLHLWYNTHDATSVVLHPLMLHLWYNTHDATSVVLHLWCYVHDATSGMLHPWGYYQWSYINGSK